MNKNTALVHALNPKKKKSMPKLKTDRFFLTRWNPPYYSGQAAFTALLFFTLELCGKRNRNSWKSVQWFYVNIWSSWRFFQKWKREYLQNDQISQKHNFQVAGATKHPIQLNYIHLFMENFSFVGLLPNTNFSRNKKKSINCPLMWRNWTGSLENEYLRPWLLQGTFIALILK